MDTSMVPVYTSAGRQSSDLPPRLPTRYVSGMSFGDRVKQRRKARGWSQERLARELNVSKNTVTRWEGGHTDAPSGGNLDALAQALGTTSDWLLHGTRKASAGAANPPHWQDFLDRYEHLAEFSEEQLEDIKGFAGRNFTIRSWTDWERIAEIVRTARPSAAFERAR